MTPKHYKFLQISALCGFPHLASVQFQFEAGRKWWHPCSRRCLWREVRLVGKGSFKTYSFSLKAQPNEDALSLPFHVSVDSSKIFNTKLNIPPQVYSHVKSEKEPVTDPLPKAWVFAEKKACPNCFSYFFKFHYFQPCNRGSRHMRWRHCARNSSETEEEDNEGPARIQIKCLGFWTTHSLPNKLRHRTWAAFPRQYYCTVRN